MCKPEIDKYNCVPYPKNKAWELKCILAGLFSISLA